MSEPQTTRACPAATDATGAPDLPDLPEIVAALAEIVARQAWGTRDHAVAAALANRARELVASAQTKSPASDGGASG